MESPLHGGTPQPAGAGLYYDQENSVYRLVTGDPYGATKVITGLCLPEHDYVELGYTGSDMTSVIYKQGGAGGTTVATLTLAYSTGILQTITRT